MIPRVLESRPVSTRILRFAGVVCGALILTGVGFTSTTQTGPGRTAQTAEPGPSPEEHMALVPVNVRNLPRAEADRWRAWVPNKEPEREYREAYRQCLQAYLADDLGSAVRRGSAMLERVPDYPPALLILGVSLYRLQRYSDAVHVYERLLHHAPLALGRTRQLGHCLHALGRTQEAIAHYTRLLDANPGDWRSLRSRGVAYLRNGQPLLGLVDVEAALEHSPRDADGLYWRALILYELDGETPTDARARPRPTPLEAAKRARNSAPFASRTWYLLAQVALETEGEEDLAHAAQARYSELLAAESALRQWQQTLWFAPERLDVIEQLGRLRLGIGDLARAKTAYQRLLEVATRLNNSEVAGRARRAIDGIESAR